ncbi:hypothetical protein [Endothiovibrio diazotrophicus]
MKAKMAMAAVLLAVGGVASAEVTVDSQTLEMVIPSLNFGGDYYSAKLSYANGCFVPYEILPLTTSSGATRVTMTHEGFDFSTGNTAPEWEQSDGYITAWAAVGFPSGYEWGSALWFTPYQFANAANGIYIMDLGEVSLDSVTTVPSDWSYAEGMTDNPLIVGHVYLVHARDGYAKFQVVSVSDMTGVTQDDFDPTVWSAEIDYVYTSGNSF